MTAKELRIDNLIEYCGEILPVRTIFSIDRICIKPSFSGDNIIQNIDKMKPIPLTEEWLIKFGFEECSEMDYIIDDIYKVMIREYRITMCNRHGYLTDLKYIHELQNLYFAVQGKELI